MSVQAYFDQLGATLEAGWSKVHRDEEAFPEIARVALDAHPALDAFDRDAFVREMLDPARPARRQLAPLGTFGQPSFTMFHGAGFLVDVYLWRNSLSAIHNHPFCGLFTVLEGWSVHAVYEHELHETVGARLSIGALRQTKLEVLERGAVQLFSLQGHPLIHALIHVPIGAISMVVRTARTVGYERYFPPSLAVALERQDEAVGRRIELLETLRYARDPRFVEYLFAFLDKADFESSFVVLTRLWSDVGAEDREALLERVRARHGERAEKLPAVMQRSRRWLLGDALRERLPDADDRFIATALMLAERRDAALRLIGERHEAPVARLHRFIDEVAPFDADDPAAPVLAHALADGVDSAHAEQRLVETFGRENVPTGQRAVLELHQRQSVFAALAE